MRIFQQPEEAAVRTLLKEADLPSSDVSDKLEHFFACGSLENPRGIVGLELLGSDALLRSLVVAPWFRGRGYAKNLVTHAENYARQNGAERIFLLTETAQVFFGRLGYEILPRDSAPESIKKTSEFVEVCPSGAVLMTKPLVRSRTNASG